MATLKITPVKGTAGVELEVAIERSGLETYDVGDGKVYDVARITADDLETAFEDAVEAGQNEE